MSQTNTKYKSLFKFLPWFSVTWKTVFGLHRRGQNDIDTIFTSVRIEENIDMKTYVLYAITFSWKKLETPTPKTRYFFFSKIDEIVCSFTLTPEWPHGPPNEHTKAHKGPPKDAKMEFRSSTRVFKVSQSDPRVCKATST